MTCGGLIGQPGLDEREGVLKKKKSFKTRTQPSAFVVMSIKAWRIPVGSLFQMVVLHMGFIFHRDRQSVRPIGPQPRLLFCLSAWFPGFEKSSETTFVPPEKMQLINDPSGLTQRIWTRTPTSVRWGMEDKDLCGYVTVEKMLEKWVSVRLKKTCSQGD